MLGENRMKKNKDIKSKANKSKPSSVHSAASKKPHQKTAVKAEVKKHIPAKKRPAPKHKPVAKPPKEIEDIKVELPSEVEEKKLPKPRFRRVRFHENGIEMYLEEGRKVTIFQGDDGTFTIETKKALKPEDDFASFVPVSIDLDSKWGLRTAKCRFVLSREAMLALGIGLNEIVKAKIVK